MDKLGNFLLRYAITLGGWTLGDITMGNSPLGMIALGGSLVIAAAFHVTDQLMKK